VELRLAGIAHVMAGDYVLGGVLDGYCWYGKKDNDGNNDLFLFWRESSQHYRVASSLDATSLYAYSSDTDAGRPEDIDVAWEVGELHFHAAPACSI